MNNPRPLDLAQRDLAYVVHPYTNFKTNEATGPFIIDRGEGVYVYDNDGRRYLEGMAGLWSTALGFSEQRLVDAATRQLKRLPYSQIFGGRSHEPGIQLAEELVKITPEGLNHVLFANSGSEANDAAVKVVWYYNNQIGRKAKKKLVGRYFGYHGVTVASGSLTGLAPVHADFDLPLDRMVHTDAPSYYHFGMADETQAQFVERLGRNLEELIQKEGPDNIAAFIAEPVMGAGGVIVPPPGYFETIQPILKKHDILFIVDEVITGFARTGEMFASYTYNLKPDMMTMAKALSSSYLPISALMMTDKIYQAISDGSVKNGAFAHGVTYAAHPVCAAVALETLAIYKERNIVEHVKKVSPRLQSGINALQNHPLIGEARGVGLIGAVELTRSKKDKAAFDGKLGMGAYVQARAAHHGVILRNMRDAVAICPPLIITEDEIEELLQGLHRALDDGLDHARKQGWV